MSVLERNTSSMFHPTDRMTLHTHPLTHNPIKLQLVMNYIAHGSARAREQIQHIQRQTVVLDQLEHKQEGFVKLNPNGKIPVLVHGDLILWESNAIAQYLASFFGSRLWPFGADQQASVLRWLLWETGCWDSVVGNILLNEFYMPFWGYPGDDSKAEKNRKLFKKRATLLNQQLHLQTYLNGEEISLADLCIAAPLMHFHAVDIDLSPYPALQTWLALLSQQPWWQQAWLEVQAFQHTHGSTKTSQLVLQ